MNDADYAAGCVALALILLPWPLVGHRLSRRLLPDWEGAASALVAAVIGVSGLLVVAELLGMAGQFARWQLAAASVVVGGAVMALVKPGPAPSPIPSPLPPAPTAPTGRRRRTASLVLAAFCVLGVSAALLARDARTLRTGPTDVDSLHYHLTEAAVFVRSESIDHLHQNGFSDPTVYYPLDDELLDAVAMLGPRPDIATLGLNLGFAWLALLACWVIGARWQMAAAAVAAGSSVLAIPLVVGSAGGPGLNDLPAIAALLASVAIVGHAELKSQRWLTATAIAGLVLGLSAGSKLSLLGVVAVLALAVVACAPARRLATAGGLTAAAILTGGFWYVRDWVAVGTPVPDVNLTLGGHGLHGVPYPKVKPYAFSVAHYLNNWSVIRHSFVPQLKLEASPWWPAVLGLPVLGILIALLTRGERLQRLLAVVAVAGIALYVVTPTTALGTEGHPGLFGTNVRYVVPVLVLSALLLATAAPLRRFGLPLTVGFTALTFIVLSYSVPGAPTDRPAGWAAAAVIVAAGSWLYAVVRSWPSRTVLAAVAVVVPLALAIAGVPVQRHYLHDRYAAGDPRARVFAVASSIHHQRIGVVGFAQEYPFFGPRLDNAVSYAGVSAGDHSFGAPTSCPAWRRLLATNQYRYVVIEPQPLEHTTTLRGWTAAIPGARRVTATSAGTVFELPQRISAVGCRSGH